VKAAREVVRRWLGDVRPTVAIVLGSGLGRLTERLEHPIRLPYRDIPGFPRPGVQGHAGELVAGGLAGRTVLCQSGRFHAYEGHDAATVALPVRLFAALGIETLLLTNAAGGIRRTFRPGTLMLIADQVNLSFRNPLTGGVPDGEARFPDMSAPYDASLRAAAHEAAHTSGVALEDGVYGGVMGPSYETPAEVRMLERMGVDAVGMSTVLEVVAARARGVRCLGLSIIANLASGISPSPLTHEEVMATARAAGAALEQVITGVLTAT
jgi:purine-nucleoside phosphorylase